MYVSLPLASAPNEEGPLALSLCTWGGIVRGSTFAKTFLQTSCAKQAVLVVSRYEIRIAVRRPPSALEATA